MHIGDDVLQKLLHFKRLIYNFDFYIVRKRKIDEAVPSTSSEVHQQKQIKRKIDESEPSTSSETIPEKQSKIFIFIYINKTCRLIII